MPRGVYKRSPEQVEHLRKIAASGGSAQTDKPKGFAAMDEQKHLEASRKGGMNKHESSQQVHDGEHSNA